MVAMAPPQQVQATSNLCAHKYNQRAKNPKNNPPAPHDPFFYSHLPLVAAQSRRTYTQPNRFKGQDRWPAYQYVYVMKDLTKAYPGGREVFKGITLSFLPGVKIGVLGVNGAGKSTLLKIIAGIEKEYGGEAWAAEGARVGYLAQEPHLDPTKTVGENVAEAFADLRAALARFNAISDEFAEPMDDAKMDALLAEQAKLQELIDAAGRLGPRPPHRNRARRAALPGAGPARRPALGR